MFFLNGREVIEESLAYMIQPTHLGEVRPVCQSPVWLTNPLTWHHRNLHSCSASQEISSNCFGLPRIYLLQFRTKQAQVELLCCVCRKLRGSECQKRTAYLCHFNPQLHHSNFGDLITKSEGLCLKDMLPEDLWLVFQPVRGHIPWTSSVSSGMCTPGALHKSSCWQKAMAVM